MAINSNGNGFLANNSNLFIYSLPIVILLEIVFLLVFKFTFKYPFSKIFRKYSFLAILLLMIFYGNIEQFAFYIFEELKLFFSNNFTHRIVNIVLLQFFFLAFFMGIGGYIWFITCHYKKRISYFAESYRLKFKIIALLGHSIDNGLIFLMFGAAHSLLRNHPILQLCVLIVIEAFWICSRVYYLTHDIYKMRLVIWIQIITGFNRILFQLASMAYDKWPINFINESIHLNLILIFIVLWALEIVITIKEATSGIMAFVKNQDKIISKRRRPVIHAKSIRSVQVDPNFRPIKTNFFTI